MLTDRGVAERERGSEGERERGGGREGEEESDDVRSGLFDVYCGGCRTNSLRTLSETKPSGTYVKYLLHICILSFLIGRRHNAAINIKISRLPLFTCKPPHRHHKHHENNSAI